MVDDFNRTDAAVETHYQFLMWLTPALEKIPRSRRRRFALVVSDRSILWSDRNRAAAARQPPRAVAKGVPNLSFGDGIAEDRCPVSSRTSSGRAQAPYRGSWLDPIKNSSTARAA